MSAETKVIDGVEYNRFVYDGHGYFWQSTKKVDEWGHRVLCDCGNDTFTVISGGYWATGKCTKCGLEDELASD